jgi:ferredoxin
MGTGPRPTKGFDLCLTEILDEEGHRFVVEVGTDRGAEVLDAVTDSIAADADLEAAAEVTARAVERMGRSMETEGLRDLLYGAAESPRWEAIAERCLACGNCTAVCPTCFCTGVEDVTSLAGDEVVRERVWDSCFDTSFSYLHGGAVRGSTGARYRQWMTHKLAGWQDQFGSSGCVGCGRCITWCPVGIDITEEVAHLRGTTEEERP